MEEKGKKKDKIWANQKSMGDEEKEKSEEKKE